MRLSARKRGERFLWQKLVHQPSENRTAMFHIAGLNEAEKDSIPQIRAPYDTDVYCVTCNKTVHVKAGEVVPFCCGRLMEILD